MNTFQCDTYSPTGKFLSRENAQYRSQGAAVKATVAHNGNSGNYTVVKPLGVKK